MTTSDMATSDMTTSDMERMLVELSESYRTRFFGKYRGLVQEVADPENRGRIIAQVPEVYGEDDSPWANPVVPFAGPKHGFVALPEVGDGVWIEFEAGDLSRPLWTGCWWADGDLPSPAGPESRAWITSGGHKVVLDDANQTLQLLHSGGAELTMTNTEITLKIGVTQLVLSASGVNVNNGAFQVR